MSIIKGPSNEAGLKPRLQRWFVYAGLCIVVVYILQRGMRGARECNHWKKLPLSTKSPYPSADARNYTAPEGFELVQVQYVLRHGARYEVEHGIDSIQQIYDVLHDHVPHVWLKPDMADKDKAALLAESGYVESAKLGQRMQTRYAELLSRSQQGVPAVRFVSSDMQRTIATANAFRTAADPLNQTTPVAIIPLENDTILAIKPTCPRWIADHELVKSKVDEEQNIFASIYGAELQSRIGKQLGLGSKALAVKEIQLLYRLCGYDLSLYNEHAHWCTLFDQQTSALLELYSDIMYSRVYGPYGTEINSHIACSLFSTIVDDIDSALRDPASAVSTFRFGHAETLMFASTLLGLDQALGQTMPPITGNMTLEQSLRRGFRTTVMVPFSANLGIELYKDQNSQAFFRLLLNERVVRLTGCSEDMCALGVLRSKLASDVGCSYNEVCRL